MKRLTKMMKLCSQLLLVVWAVSAIPKKDERFKFIRVFRPMSIEMINFLNMPGPGATWKAFGAVEAMSDRICISSNGKVNAAISAENLLACCSSCGDGCLGGIPSEAWRYYERQGLVTGGLYNSSQGCQPYSIPACDHHVVGHLQPCPTKEDAETPKCSNKCQANYNVTYKADKHYGKNSYSVDSVEKNYDRDHDQWTCGSRFHRIRRFSKLQIRTGQELGGHAIKILGWGVDSGTPFWIAANSWNPDWGNQGFFNILRGKDECGIESVIVAGLPKLS